MSGMSGRIVEVRIEELALDGVRSADRDRIAAVTTRELERLLGEHGAWAGGPASVVDVDAGDIAIDGPPTPDSLGTGIARTVHRRLVR